MILRRVVISLTALTLTSCGVSVGAPVRADSSSPTSKVSRSVTSVVPDTAAPLAISIPAIDVSSSLLPLGQTNGEIDVPSVHTPLQAGWYTYSPRPGDPGPAIILGHVDGDHKEGVFWRLKAVKVGDEITITRADGSSLVYVVSRTDRISKDIFPTDAVYGNTTDSELRIITCGGVFDRSVHSYVDNIIVWAKVLT